MLVGGRAEAAAAADTGGGGRRKHTQDQKSAYIPLVLKDAALGIIEQPLISFSYLHREIASPDVSEINSQISIDSYYNCTYGIRVTSFTTGD